MTGRLIRPAIASLLVLASGCTAPSGEYPSLAVREGELAAGSMAVPVAAPLPDPARATLDRLVPLAQEARAAHAAFTDAADASSRLVRAARGAAPGSESWSVAQVALGDLASRRSRGMVALADLDRLFVDAAAAGESTAAIAPVRDEVGALLAEEDRLLGQLIAQVAN